MPGVTPDRWDVPEAWRDAAEEVRAHLCQLRGGAPFLSSADAWTLLGWLEQGVPAGSVLRAIERAAESRRRSRSKVPLALWHAKRHLGRPTRGLFAAARPTRGGEPVLAPVVRALKTVPPEPDPAPRRALEAALLAVDGQGEAAIREALEHVRRFLDDCWKARGPDGQAALRRAAVEDLGDLLHLVDEATATALVDETARDLLRQCYPALSAASLWELLGTDG